MTDRVTQTGVTLRCAPLVPRTHDEIEVTAEVWAEVEQEGEPVPIRVGGNYMHAELTLGQDPTRQLMEIAYAQRDGNLGSILGKLRLRDVDVTRFECYSAPFRVELGEDLRDLLSGSWDERDPDR